MPIYEFRCADCGNVQEIIVSSSKTDPVEMKCQACEGETLERVLSPVSYSMGSDAGASPRVSARNCGSGNTCSTIDIPGPSK
ncbi:MAG: FmdB family zinc ribbon protein [Thermodesulfobacteriota bacterium]